MSIKSYTQQNSYKLNLNLFTFYTTLVFKYTLDSLQAWETSPDFTLLSQTEMTEN